MDICRTPLESTLASSFDRPQMIVNNCSSTLVTFHLVALASELFSQTTRQNLGANDGNGEGVNMNSSLETVRRLRLSIWTCHKATPTSEHSHPYIPPRGIKRTTTIKPTWKKLTAIFTASCEHLAKEVLRRGGSRDEPKIESVCAGGHTRSR